MAEGGAKVGFASRDGAHAWSFRLACAQTIISSSTALLYDPFFSFFTFKSRHLQSLSLSPSFGYGWLVARWMCFLPYTRMSRPPHRHRSRSCSWR